MILDSLFAESASSHGMTIRVSPNYLSSQSQPDRGQWFWSYHIRIENHGDEPVQLLSRHWKITDGRGAVSHVDGDGVVGEQPILAPGGAHDYVSGCPLSTPTGSMEGCYRFIQSDGNSFLADIPRFALIAPAAA